MKERLSNIFRGEVISFLFYVIFGLCLILMPVQMINVICKVVFGFALIGAGAYNIYNYVGEKKERASILDLFSGVIVFVLGVFLFLNPQVVMKILPFLLGAFILVDSIWTLRGCFRLYKRNREEWKFLLAGGIVFVTLGAVLVADPFIKTTYTVIFAGWVFLANGAADFALLYLLRHGMKKADEAVQVVEASVEQNFVQPTKDSGKTKAEAELVEVQTVVLETETPAPETPSSLSYAAPDREEEILEEWKD